MQDRHGLCPDGIYSLEELIEYKIISRKINLKVLALLESIKETKMSEVKNHGHRKASLKRWVRKACLGRFDLKSK